MSKGKKRFLIACVAVLVAGITLVVALMNDVTDVVATQKVFEGMTKNFGTTKQVNILEIVPTDEVYSGKVTVDTTEIDYNINTKSELGYFMPLSISQQYGTYNVSSEYKQNNPLYVSRGAVHGVIDTYEPDNDAHDDSGFKNHLYNLYQYGLIKPNGSDAGWYTGISEYPIYAATGIFSSVKTGDFDQFLAGRLVDGYYYYNRTNTGKYYIDPTKFYINEYDNNTFYIVNSISTNSMPNSVSVNSVGGVVYVSGNSIVDIASSELSLPKDRSGVVVVEDRTNTNDGNADFEYTMGVASPFHLYKGFPSNASLAGVYFTKDESAICKNGDWWNEYVMGDLKTYESAKVDTPYTVKAAKNVTVNDIINADLIYISGTYESFTTAAFSDGSVGSDISEDVLLQIYNDEVNYKHKAVMMDYAVYDASLGNNISKLAALLWQKSQSAFYTNNVDDHPTWFTAGTVTDTAKGSTVAKEQSYHNLNTAALADTALWSAAKETMVPAGIGNGNFITGNTYVYNHHMSDFTGSKVMLDALDIFANGDFKTPYTGTVVEQGFSAVSRYIDATNKNSYSDLLSTDITPAVCIQYILVSEGVDLDVMKTSLRVLEIEPVPAFLYNTQRGSQEYAELNDSNSADSKVKNNRKDFVQQYLSSFYTEEDRINFIEFTSMTIYEFNARNEDLVETYDIIYIGDETTRNGKNLYYTDSSPRNTMEWNDSKNEYELQKIALSNFRDDNMIGNLYYNVGDKVQVFGMFQSGDNDGVSGWLDDDTFKDPNVIWTRYSPRDITKNNLAKLKEFVESKALVLVAEGLFGTPSGDVKNTQVNPTIVTGNKSNDDVYGRVDNSSNLYEFLNFALGKNYYVDADGLGSYVTPTSGGTVYENVVSVADIKRGLVDKELLAEYVSTEKLALNLIDKPTPYTYSAQSNGVITSSAYLNTIDDDGTRYLEYKFTIEGDSENTAELGYSVALYVDINKDGKFSKTTENVQDIVITIDSNGQEALKNEANEYVLSPSVEYTLRRDIANDFSGLLNWKLDIKSNKVSHIHDSASGYTLVKDANAQKKKIRILQITNDNSTLDMEARLYNARTSSTSNNWSLLMNKVPDYELYIRTIKVSEYQTALQNKYNEYVAKVNKDNLSLPDAEKVTPMTYTEYAQKSYDTFFKDFVVQNVNLKSCSETPQNHSTPGPSNSYIKASELKSRGYTDEIGVDMIVCGFGDDYKAFTSSEALIALQAFIQMGKPVLTTHDFVHFRIGVSQNRVLRNSFGADLYGVTQNLTVTTDSLTGNQKVSMLNAWNPVTVKNNTDFKAQRISGADLLGYLHSSYAYTRSANADVFEVIENTGKEVSYQPNSLRNTTTPETQGLSSMIIEWNRNNNISKKSWMNANNCSAGKYSWNSGGQNDLGGDKLYMVEQVNEGQITNYPYRLKKSFRTLATHSQYYCLDLTSDLDNDEESDVVVWYALGDSSKTDPNAWGDNPYSETSGGSINPANGYYIYNDGNITYTGAGHSNLTDAKLDEVELFINTLIAAYETGISNPSVNFYNSPDINDKPITSVVVPYDGNVTDPDKGSGNKFDSSILKTKGSSEYMYKFVDPNTESSKGVTAADGTMVYYRVGDYNFVRGTKNITTRYYLQVPSVIKDEENNKIYYEMPDKTKLDVVSLDVNGTPVSAVDISNRINTYATSGMLLSDTAMTKNKDGSISGVESGRAYGFYLPMNLLNENAGFTILVEAQTTITTISTSGYGKNTTTEKAYQSLSVVKADLLDLD